jgi:predicted  nucleic acid-binding Zn-ribbon protein
MKIECSKCGDIVETTAKTVVAPFVCNQCTDVCGPEKCVFGSQSCVDAHKRLTTPTTGPFATADEVRKSESFDSCDTATVENTTLLIEDLQQQLQDERATVIALEAENAKLKLDYVERMTQIADLKAEVTQTKEIYNHVNDELVIARQNFIEAHEQITAMGVEKFEVSKTMIGWVRAYFNQVALLDSRNGRLQKEISLLKENEDKLIREVAQQNASRKYWLERAVETMTEVSRLWRKNADLERQLEHPIRSYFKQVWADSRGK